MAKKVVATLKKEGGTKNHAKVIKMIKNAATGNYSFKEQIVRNEEIKEWMQKDHSKEKGA